MKFSRYSSTPSLRVGADTLVAEYNLAIRLLMGDNLAACLGQPVDKLLGNLTGRLTGDLLPPDWASTWQENLSLAADQSWVLECHASYASMQFGRVDLRNLAIPNIDSETGTPRGAFVYCHPVRIECERAFWKALRDVWDHELMWEMYAASYDRVLPRLPFYRDMIQSHVDTLKAAGAVDILDLGAGTGNATLPLLKLGCRVTAVDSTRAMLDQLLAKVPEGLAESLTVIEENAEHLPQLADESFDGITISHALYDMTNPDAAWGEVMRLLRPKGVLAITEPNDQFDLQCLLDAGENALREQDLYESLKQHWQRVSRAGHELRILERSARLRPIEIAHRLEAEGFREISVQPTYLGSCSRVVGIKPLR